MTDSKIMIILPFQIYQLISRHHINDQPFFHQLHQIMNARMKTVSTKFPQRTLETHLKIICSSRSLHFPRTGQNILILTDEKSAFRWCSMLMVDKHSTTIFHLHSSHTVTKNQPKLISLSELPGLFHSPSQDSLLLKRWCATDGSQISFYHINVVQPCPTS